MNKISIYGLGQFGFAISKHLADKYKDNLEFSINGYEIDSKVRNELQNHRKHPYHFPNITLPENVNIAYTLDSLIQDSDLIVLAIPAQTIRENIKVNRIQRNPLVNMINLNSNSIFPLLISL